jgi:hypothetical protein
MNLNAFSQTLVLNKKDTTICFSINQAKYLLKEQYKLQECQALLNICETQKTLLDSVIANQRLNANNLKSVIFNQKTLISYKDLEITSCNDKIAYEQKKVRKQKVYKWLAIGGGCLLSGYLGYKYLTK